MFQQTRMFNCRCASTTAIAAMLTISLTSSPCCRTWIVCSSQEDGTDGLGIAQAVEQLVRDIG